MKLAILLGLIVLLLGCTQGTVAQDSFELNKSFSVKEGKTYFNEETGILISVKEFNDSRCPKDVVCVWAGEQGVELIFGFSILGKNFTGKSTPILLGETTNPKEDAGNYSVELVSIDIDNGVAEIKVTKNSNITPDFEVKWFAIEPIQCGGNEWQQWETANVLYKKNQTEKESITSWFSIVHGIEVLKIDSRLKYEIVCEACSCARGDELAVLVNGSHAKLMESLGFTAMENIACTKEAKVCEDGSGVGREAPFCEFAECPDGEQPKVVDEPIIIKTDSSGFSVVGEFITGVTKIYDDGKVTIETKEFYEFGETISLEYDQLTEQEMLGLTDLILNSGFFEITKADTELCLADAPSHSLEINIGADSNEVDEIGLQCDITKMADAIAIVDEIELLLEN